MIIPPRITAHDEFGQTIEAIIKKYKPSTAIDIGASSGEGTTAILANHGVKSWAIEVEPDRIKRFTSIHGKNKSIKLITQGSVNAFMTMSQLEYYYKKFPYWNCWRSVGYPEMLKWLGNNRRHGGHGIDEALNESGGVDMVIMDGSPFTGVAELMKLYGTKIIIMDDVDDVKNHTPFMMMGNDYQCIHRSKFGNGYAIFVKI